VPLIGSSVGFRCRCLRDRPPLSLHPGASPTSPTTNQREETREDARMCSCFQPSMTCLLKTWPLARSRIVRAEAAVRQGLRPTSRKRPSQEGM